MGTTAVDWCDVAPIVAERCERCHDQPPAYGAPFALLDYADTQAPAPTAADPERQRLHVIYQAVESGIMPPQTLLLDPPVQPLSCAQRATLLSWLEAGAPPPTRDPDCGRETGRLVECTEGDHEL